MERRGQVPGTREVSVSASASAAERGGRAEFELMMEAVPVTDQETDDQPTVVDAAVDTAADPPLPELPEVKAKAKAKDKAKDNNFHFLTFTDIQQTTDAKTKRKVRSHVMHRVHQTMRTGKRELNEGVIVLDTSSLLDLGEHQPYGVQGHGHGQDMNMILLPAPSLLGAGRLNPFANYPIPMNPRTRHLFDHLHQPFCPMFKTMSKIGFFQTMTDPAGFRQVLCTSALHMEVLRSSGSEPFDALMMSYEALKSVNDRIADPAHSTSDGMVAAVLAFCCHSIMFRDQKAAVTHWTGLKEIVRLRGGLESLQSSSVLRMMLFWCDTNVAFTEDTPPEYPLPVDLLSPYMAEPAAVAEALIPTYFADACTSADLASAMRDLSIQNQLLIHDVLPRDGWSDGVFANLNLMPVLYKLLSIRHHRHLGLGLGHGSASIAICIKQAAYRAGAILYIAAVRVKFAIDFNATLHIRTLKDALDAMERRNIDCDLPVLVWLLVVGGTRSFFLDDDGKEHDFFVAQLAQVVAFMGWQAWENQVMYHVQDVFWADGVAQEECEVLRKEVSDRVRSSYGRVFV